MTNIKFISTRFSSNQSVCKNTMGGRGLITLCSQIKQNYCLEQHNNYRRTGHKKIPVYKHKVMSDARGTKTLTEKLFTNWRHATSTSRLQRGGNVEYVQHANSTTMSVCKTYVMFNNFLDKWTDLLVETIVSNQFTTFFFS